MSTKFKLPEQFFRDHGTAFTLLELDRDLNDHWVDAFEFDLETMRGDVQQMREEAEANGELDALRTMLEFIASAGHKDVPFDIGVCGLWFPAVALFDEEMNHIVTGRGG